VFNQNSNGLPFYVWKGADNNEEGNWESNLINETTTEESHSIYLWGMFQDIITEI
jgi:hypothetical protein